MHVWAAKLKSSLRDLQISPENNNKTIISLQNFHLSSILPWDDSWLGMVGSLDEKNSHGYQGEMSSLLCSGKIIV